MESNNQQIEISMQNEMDGVEPTMQKQLSSMRSLETKCCIYKVPEFIKKGKEEFYEPSVVSIGPAYYKNPKLQTMQQYKWFFLESFLNKHPKNACRSLNCYTNIVRESNKDIRDCYDESLMTSCDDDEFIEMIVLDAIFLLCVLMFYDKENRSPVEYADNFYYSYKLRVLMTYMRKDIFLGENQLPLFVLQRIFDLAFPAQLPSLVDLVRKYISTFTGYPGSKYVASTVIGDGSSIAHLIDFWRKSCCSSLATQQVEPKLVEFPGTAKHLCAAGVKFKKSESLNPLCITFNSNNGELHIPQLALGEGTEVFSRNFLHFEQCHYFFKNQHYFIDLFFFLDSLIDSAEDIRLLEEKEILKNVLGSTDKAANIFNNISTGLFAEAKSNYFSHISEEVNAYANKSWNRWMAILRRDYFSHPWAIISFIFGSLLFILTVLQTITGFTKN